MTEALFLFKRNIFKIIIMIDIYKHSNYYIAKVQLTEANMDQSDAFKQGLLNELDSGKKQILISFEDVHYIDSSFLGALVAVLKHALSIGGDLAVFGLNDNILHLFELIRMDKVFRVFKDLPDSYNDGWVV